MKYYWTICRLKNKSTCLLDDVGENKDKWSFFALMPSLFVCVCLCTS